MKERSPWVLRASTILMTGVGGFALGLQFYLTMKLSHANGRTPVDGVITYFSFFTILTNALVTVSLGVPLVIPNSRATAFFSRTGPRSAVAAYIAMVGIAYSLLLRHVWSPEGWQWVADVLLHDLIPVLYVLYWILLVPKGTLRYRQVLAWLAYPTAYVVYALIRGALSSLYPYPFLDVSKLGYPRVGVNVLVLLVGFLGISLGVAVVDRLMSRGAPSEGPPAR